MKKIIILIPVFNDWESLKILLKEINEIINDIENVIFECLVVNDASTIKQPFLKKPNNIKSLKVLNMKKNKGHARCNAFGIRYVSQNEKFNYLILMDGDGEDRPIEIKALVDKVSKIPNNSVVAKRIKRSEGPFFQFLYFSHKILTYFFTGKKINFGNYSCLTKKDVNILTSKPSLWSSYSGSVKKNLSNLSEIDSTRGLRYSGPSQMSLFKLFIHSFSIMAVFKYQVFFRSFFLLLLFNYLIIFLPKISLITQILIILFNLVILAVSFREKKEDLLNSQENLKNIEDITH
tara:strand:+ start:1429 stop:2301 length:873 start_codon:yes stop_codon:yes gene_type:complete